MLVTCLGVGSPYSYVYDQPATMLVSKPNADGVGKTNLKGRLNFLSLGTAPGHVITLSDSNAQKTIATAGNRPVNDVNDAYVGLDQGDGGVTNVGISFGAPKSISNYIGNSGDGSNWLERLTSSAKTFKTNVTVQGNLTVTGTCTGCGGGGSITLKTNGVNNGSQSILNLKGGSNVTLTDDGSGGVTIASSGGSGGSVTSVFGRTGVIAAQAGDYTVAQITGAETAANKGVANGYASLDATGKVPSSQLPSGSGLTWPLQAAQDGTSSAPVYSFANETTLGLYRFGPGQMGVAGDLRFNRLFSSSTSAPQTGVSIGLGATDAMSAYYASSDETCGSTPCARLIRKRSGTGEAELGTHYGVYISGPLTSSVITGNSPFVVASSTLVSNLNADMVDSASASVTPAASTIPIADGTGKIASGWLPAISESGVTNLTTDMAGMEKTANKGIVNGYASLDGTGKLASTQMPALTESQITGLSSDLAAKLGSTGPQTFSGDLTVSGAVYANAFQSTGSGPWSVEGAYGALTAAGTGKSKLGFGTNGKLSVSENSGGVTEVAKKLPQQFTYTFFDPNNPLTMSLQVPSVYVNRATAVHVVEVYCEIDTGTATINLQNGGTNVLSSDLACSTSGAVSTSFVSGKDAIAVAAKINHVTTAVGSGLHRLNVVVKYTVD
jgi:hypothetical protein